MAATMSTSTRMPFGEISGARLQNLTSLKNRQNALSAVSPATKSALKRTIQSFEDDIDSENIDPSQLYSPKRSKSSDDHASAKPVQNHFILKMSPPCATTTRTILQARSPRTATPKLMSTMISSPPAQQSLSAPAGRSPTRRRSGILGRRRTIQRVEPPKFALDSSAPFSIAAALSGTISSYKPATATRKAPKSSWEFEIHEDTVEEEMQNLMEHGACTLDLSSDDEMSSKLKEASCNKENIAPLDDISQTVSRAMRSAVSRALEKGKQAAMELDRMPLGEVDVAELYADVEDDEESGEPDEKTGVSAEEATEARVEAESCLRVDITATSTKAALLEPIEKAEDGFQVWESGSVDGDAE